MTVEGCRRPNFFRVLKEPSALLRRASTPTAVLLSPVVFLTSALAPMAVLNLPVVLNWSALTPLACCLCRWYWLEALRLR